MYTNSSIFLLASSINAMVVFQSWTTLFASLRSRSALWTSYLAFWTLSMVETSGIGTHFILKRGVSLTVLPSTFASSTLTVSEISSFAFTSDDMTLASVTSVVETERELRTSQVLLKSTEDILKRRRKLLVKKRERI